MRLDKLSIFKELCGISSGEPDGTTAIHNDNLGEPLIADFQDELSMSAGNWEGGKGKGRMR